VLAVALPFLSIASSAQADRIPRTSATCVPGAEGPKAGVVTAISGSVFAESEYCGAIERHPLLCGSVLHEGDHLITGAGASVAFEIEQTTVYVGPDSVLRVSTDADGVPELLLEEGRVRVVDPEDVAGPGRRLATPGLVSVGHGDTEAYAPAGAVSSICEYGRPILLGDGTHTLEPGTCAGPSFAASAVAGLGVSLFDAGRCDLADARRFDPTDVAAGPVPSPFPSPLVPPPPNPVCTAGTCTPFTPIVPPPAPPLGLVESPGQNEPPPP
jgi:hypothetical protein